MARYLMSGTILAVAAAQTTYTGCHMDGSVSFCFDSSGVELAMTTLSSVSSGPAPASVSATTTAEAQTTAITGCHLHATNIFCIDGQGEEVSVSLAATPTGEFPAQYTDCHSHGDDQFCVDADGNDVAVIGLNEADGEHDDTAEATSSSEEGKMDCHFHAGVEHCVPVGQSDGSSSESSTTCNAPPTRDYNVGLRIGSIFIILATSGLAVFLPLFLHKLPFVKINSTVFTVIKQFGTGIIISTAFVHLYTHASLMFNNECLTGIQYEATTSAIVMGGLFLAFLVEYIGYRFIMSSKRQDVGNTSGSENGSTSASDSKHPHAQGSALQDISHSHAPSNFDPNTPLAVSVTEFGILFHSVLIGLTLVVAPDSSANTSGYYKTLLAVIVFHQFFEGLALGARIALLPTSALRFGIWNKILMAVAFALITPLGMAIGIGVLNEFNGNDQSTILTIGIFDALSAGVLLWVGVVDMWARDWAVTGGEMVEASLLKTVIGLLSLMVGMIVMSVLGKWA